ncbi:META domain-containing protein [Candidatus Kaiserbacteria bacterium]|nr:MAG: META domain-containing protein [Candidatus Kaiserbacteria bacterium]
MKKIIFAVIIIALATLAIVLAFFSDVDTSVPEVVNIPDEVVEKPVVASTPSSIAYTIDGTEYLLNNGLYTAPAAPGSASMTTVSIFSGPVYGDLDKDGDEDAAVLLTYSADGSGTFFYAAIARKNGDSYTSTNTLFLGDRIAPQTLEIQNGRAVYNYAVRKESDPMTTPPSLGKSLWIHLDPTTGEIGEWVKDFEGEADTSKMNLEMKKWGWVDSVEMGEYMVPTNAGAFTLTFSDGKVSVGTDCNTMGGTYTTSGSKLTFGPMMSTLMYCEGSQETMFGTMLSQVKSFAFTKKGTLEMQYGEGGVATFR